MPIWELLVPASELSARSQTHEKYADQPTSTPTIQIVLSRVMRIALALLVLAVPVVAYLVSVEQANTVSFSDISHQVLAMVLARVSTVLGSFKAFCHIFSPLSINKLALRETELQK